MSSSPLRSSVSTLFMGAVLAFSLLGCSRGYAQVVGATLSGTVTDPSGAVVPHARVSISDTSTGVTRIVRSNGSGLYIAPNLLPGNYDVRIAAPGFSTEVRTGIVLTVGASQVLNVTLQVGKVTNLVQVMGAAPQVQLATSSISAVVNSTTVRQLPLNGRSWTDLAKLQPGVNAIVTQVPFSTGSPRGNRGFGAQISISGQRPVENNYRLDGIGINDYSNGAPGSVLGGNLGVDAIQEFSVLTTNYSAEYGRTAGGVINAITKSGTNQFHGGAYEFLRNNALDAANFFDNFANKTKPAFRRNQFGASAGGPIQKDRTFVFGDYEGIRQAKGISTIDTVPSAAARQGNLVSGPIVVDPAAQKYLPIWPLPNGSVSGDTGFFGFGASQVISENYVTARVDHTFSAKDSMFGTYVYDDTPYISPDPLDNVLITDHTNRQFVILEETHIFNPALVNSARAGYGRDGVANNVGTTAINPAAADKSLGAIPGQNAAAMTVSGITPFNAGVLGSTYIFFHWNDFQGYDDAFYTHGTHSIKFGGAVERMQNNMIDSGKPAGLFTFPSLTAFLTNHPSRFTGDVGNSLSPRGLRQTLLGSYLQDDWRARPNLTLNLGLRWEMVTVPTEVQGKLANLLTIYDATPRTGSPFYKNSTHKNFEPRIGFAWDPFHNGKTAVRGGVGVFDVLPLLYVITPDQAYMFPFFNLGNARNLPAGSFYTGAYSLLQGGSSTTAYLPQDTKRNYVMQWNLNIQRQLNPSTTAMIGYIGSRSIHNVFRADDINMAVPTRTPAGYLFPSPAGSGAVYNSNFGDIGGNLWGGYASYNGLEAAISKTMAHGVQLQGSFTWGKSIDQGSATLAGDQFANSISSLPFYSMSAIQAPADFNVGRTLAVNAIWDMPTPKSWRGVRQAALGGWELGGIFTASDGVPFTATWGTDGDPQGLGSSDPWDFPNRLNGPGCNSLVNSGDPNNYIKTQCFAVPTAPSAAFYAANCDPANAFPQCFNLRGNSGRNVLTGPGLADVDFSLYKNFPVRRVSENFNVQFRAEFFNVLNRPNFSPPVTPDNTDIFNSSGAPTGVAGLLTSTTTDPREVQFALKVIW